jgi:oxygen-independent coproporphyrinogen-3 oxidase
MSNVSEFSIEINPRTITTDKAMILRENNINRVSIGAQTFNEEGLKILGRAHSTKHISSTVSICREAGLENISLDLINSWPAQTVDNWLEDLEKTVALRPKHISSYCLMYEEGTPLFRKREKGILKVLGEDTEREMFDITGAFLGQNGFERYEISNFSLPGFECKHNISYWEGEEYIGLGVGAHSHVEGVRSSNTSDIASYIRMIAESGVAKNWQEKLIPEHSAREKMIIALRMSKGIDIKKFESDTGFEIYDLFGRDIKALLNDGWLISEKGRIFLSEKALPVSDSILMELIA